MRVAWGARAVSAALLFLFGMVGSSATAAAQTPQPTTAEPPALELNKYPGLLPEFGQLMEKIQNGVETPAARTQSRLLPLLPASTAYYIAIPNYGETAQQALSIFHHELASNVTLNKWWHGPEMAESGPKIENAIQKFSQLSQYLGDEIVIAGGIDGPQHSLLMIAEVRNPGLKEFIQKSLTDLPPTSKLPVKLFDLESLAAADATSAPQSLAILVRPEYVIAAANVQALRNFNHTLDEKTPGLAGTPFGERMGESYRKGASVLAGIDLQALLKQLPNGADKQRQTLESTGFGDVKYLVWEHKSLRGQATSQAELSFTGQRKGIASWLAAPATPRGLEFVSPHALFATTLVLKNFADVFADIETLATAKNPDQMASLHQMQQAMNLDLKRDLLHHFDGEITLAVESMQPNPAWMAVAKVNDADGLQQTFSKLMMTMPFAPEEFEENGLHYHVLHVPSPQKPLEIAYTFVDGYMLVASSRDMATAVIARRQSGDSLAKSQGFRASLPPGHPEGVSALVYEDPVAMASLNMGHTPPEVASLFSQLKTKGQPIVICAYAAPNAIREASVSNAADAGTMMIVAAIAIPNLMRARMAANESSAAATMRVINTAEVSYSASYPQQGYARDLASLGPDPRGPKLSSQHAGLIDQHIGGPTCSGNTPCVKDGYEFTVHAVCGFSKCMNYVALAKPVSPSTGMRSFCSTSDAIVRVDPGPPMASSLSVMQCKRWLPLK